MSESKAAEPCWAAVSWCVTQAYHHASQTRWCTCSPAGGSRQARGHPPPPRSKDRLHRGRLRTLQPSCAYWNPSSRTSSLSKWEMAKVLSCGERMGSRSSCGNKGYLVSAAQSRYEGREGWSGRGTE